MGTELDPKFRIRSPLRCDGVGSLDCAEDTQSGMRLAIRWLPVDANGEAAVKAVEEMPRHPVLPRIRQTGRVGSSAYVAMDFPDGRLLATMVGGEPIPNEHVTRMGAAIADALGILHGQGMVHGELSADSVLMLADGKAILWDVPLVLANRMTDRRGEERALAQLIKVAPYLAPERARGLPASAASDIYALGAVMCIAAGGELPPGGTTLAVVHQVANGQWTPELPRSMTPAVRALVKRMIQADPLSRPNAKQIADDLAAMLDRSPTIPEMRAVVVPPPLPAGKTKTPVNGTVATSVEAPRTASSSGLRQTIAAVQEAIAARDASSSGVRPAIGSVEPGAPRTSSSPGVRPSTAQEQSAAASTSGVRPVIGSIESVPARTASSSGVRPAIAPEQTSAASTSGVRPVVGAEPVVAARTASSSGVRPAIATADLAPGRTASSSGVRPVVAPEQTSPAATSSVRPAIATAEPTSARTASSSGIRPAIAQEQTSAASTWGVRPAIASVESASARIASSSGVRPAVGAVEPVAAPRTASSSGVRPAIGQQVQAAISGADSAANGVEPGAATPAAEGFVGASCAATLNAPQSLGVPTFSAPLTPTISQPLPRQTTDEVRLQMQADATLTPASVMLERSLAEEARVHAIAEAKKKWILAGAAIVSLCALVVGGITVVRLAQRSQWAPPAATSSLTQTAKTNPSTTEAAPAGEDVSDFVAPLVNDEPRSGEASFRPAQKTSARPHHSTRPSVNEPTSATNATSSTERPRANDEHDFSFLPSNEEAPKSELKRPSF